MRVVLRREGLMKILDNESCLGLIRFWIMRVVLGLMKILDNESCFDGEGLRKIMKV